MPPSASQMFVTPRVRAPALRVVRVGYWRQTFNRALERCVCGWFHRRVARHTMGMVGLAFRRTTPVPTSARLGHSWPVNDLLRGSQTVPVNGTVVVQAVWTLRVCVLGNFGELG